MAAKSFQRLTTFSVLLCLLALGWPATAAKWGPQRLTFAGGPPGGTFEAVAKDAISRVNAGQSEMVLSYSITGGSVENLRRINSAQADLGIVYAGDIFLGRVGRLPFDFRTYERVLALAPLYAAPAQLVVRAESEYTSVDKLVGKRIAVGGIGSGTAATAQRYFTSLGLWDRIKPEFIGYQDAISALAHGYVDAIWVFAGLPNAAVVQAARSYPIRLVNLAEMAEQSGFLAQYPFFSRVTIPAGIYPGVDEPIETFADTAVWVAGAHVETDLVRKLLRAVESGDPKKESLLRGYAEDIAPYHPGAEMFWKDKR